MKKSIILLLVLFLVIGGIFLYKHRPGGQSAGKKVLFYRNPMNAEITSPVPMKDSMGMDYIPVYEEAKEKEEKKILYYRNPMNGAITSPVPMKDDMGMDYIPVYEEGKTAEIAGPAGQPVMVKLQGGEISRAQVASATVKIRPLYKEIRTVGRIAYDPDLVVAQQEYLTSLETIEKLADGSDQEAIKRASSVAEQAKYRLTLLGMSAAQIMEVERSGSVQNNLVIAGHSVWVYADVYQEEAPLVKVGDKIDVFTEAVPNETFSGTIKAIDPVLNEMTRSVKIRAEIANHELKLKPGMYVNAVININLGEKLAVPREAVLDTGLRKVVWIDKGGGSYERRDIEIGTEVNAAGENYWQKYYQVLKGLRNNEKVVSRANFLIDSQSIISGTGMGAAYSGAIDNGQKKEEKLTEPMPTGRSHQH